MLWWAQPGLRCGCAATHSGREKLNFLAHLEVEGMKRISLKEGGDSVRRRKIKEIGNF